VFGITKYENDYYVVLERTANGESTLIAKNKLEQINQAIHLQIKADGDDYYFNYATGKNDFINLGGKMSGDILSTNIAGGFTGCVIGLYATSGNYEL
jgi:alpha-N-arabinofuranosidase